MKLTELICPLGRIRWSLELDQAGSVLIIKVERGGRTKTYLRHLAHQNLERALLTAQKLMAAKMKRGYVPASGMAAPQIEYSPRPQAYSPKRLKLPCYSQPQLLGTPVSFVPGEGLKFGSGCDSYETWPELERALAHMPAFVGIVRADGTPAVLDLSNEGASWATKHLALAKLARETEGSSVQVVATRFLETLEDVDQAHEDNASLGCAGTVYHCDGLVDLIRPNICRTSFPIVGHEESGGKVVWICEAKHGKQFGCCLGNAALRKTQLAHAAYFHGRKLIVAHRGWEGSLPAKPRGLQFG